MEALADVVHDNRDIGASVASGSFRTEGMVVVPCSIKTVSAIATGHADTLIARAADVTLKEGRRLIAVVRETPLHVGHLRHAGRAGRDRRRDPAPHARLLPSRPKTIDDVVDHTVARILDRLGIDQGSSPSGRAARATDRLLTRPPRRDPMHALCRRSRPGPSGWWTPTAATPSRCARPTRLRAVFDRVVRELGLHAAGEPVWRVFPGEGGVTGLLLLTESHLACHTFPERGFAAFNLYCCRPRPGVAVAGAPRARRWARADVSVTALARGTR